MLISFLYRSWNFFISLYLRYEFSIKNSFRTSMINVLFILSSDNDNYYVNYIIGMLVYKDKTVFVVCARVPTFMDQLVDRERSAMHIGQCCRIASRHVGSLEFSREMCRTTFALNSLT